MKKKMAAFLAMLMLVSVLAACVKKPEGIKQSEPATKPSSGQTESSRPEVSTPDATVPEASEPSASKPAETVPPVSEPEVTIPDPSIPEVTIPEPSIPEETVPAPSTPGGSLPGIGTDPGGFGELHSWEELLELDSTKKGYGPGTQVDGANRPLGAIKLQDWYEKYDAYFIAPDDGALYLTFDEGYENGYTTQILDVLKQKDVKAVFFVTMSYCKRNPQLVQRMINEGHAVGNHSVNHKSMPTLTIREMVDEVMGLHKYVLDNFGYEMHLFRPPMGEYSKQSLAVLQNLGYKTVEWSFAYYDYDTANQMDPAKAYDKVVGAGHSGGIFLLHAVSKTNTEILGDVIDEFRRQGYDLKLFD